jgi:hypothetical protein
MPFANVSDDLFWRSRLEQGAQISGRKGDAHYATAAVSLEISRARATAILRVLRLKQGMIPKRGCRFSDQIMPH